MIEIYRYGPPEGANLEDLKREFDEAAASLESFVKDPIKLREIYNSARITGHLSDRDLEKQFTC
jgi:hypothetical protein